MTETSVQVNYLLRTKMALHATKIEQPLLLGRFALGTLQAVEGLHNAGRRMSGRFNRVARIKSKER